MDKRKSKTTQHPEEKGKETRGQRHGERRKEERINKNAESASGEETGNENEEQEQRVRTRADYLDFKAKGKPEDKKGKDEGDSEGDRDEGENGKGGRGSEKSDDDDDESEEESYSDNDDKDEDDDDDEKEKESYSDNDDKDEDDDDDGREEESHSNDDDEDDDADEVEIESGSSEGDDSGRERESDDSDEDEEGKRRNNSSYKAKGKSKDSELSDDEDDYEERETTNNESEDESDNGNGESESDYSDDDERERENDCGEDEDDNESERVNSRSDEDDGESSSERASSDEDDDEREGESECGEDEDDNIRERESDCDEDEDDNESERRNGHRGEDDGESSSERASSDEDDDERERESDFGEDEDGNESECREDDSEDGESDYDAADEGDSTSEHDKLEAESEGKGGYEDDDEGESDDDDEDGDTESDEDDEDNDFRSNTERDYERNDGKRKILTETKNQVEKRDKEDGRRIRQVKTNREDETRNQTDEANIRTTNQNGKANGREGTRSQEDINYEEETKNYEDKARKEGTRNQRDETTEEEEWRRQEKTKEGEEAAKPEERKRENKINQEDEQELEAIAPAPQGAGRGGGGGGAQTVRRSAPETRPPQSREDFEDARSRSSGGTGGDDPEFRPEALAEYLGQRRDFQAPEGQMRAQFSWQVNRALALLPHIFCLRDEKIALRPKIRVCSAYTSRNGCTDRSSCINIHICPDFIFGGCENEDCGMGHNLSTKHNTKAIQAFYLGCLSDKQLRHLVKKNEVAFQRKTAQQYLDVCEDYSEKKCKKNCGALHICLDFVLGMGECSTPGCRLSHDLYSSENFRLLEVYEFDTTANLRKILTDIIYSNPHLQRILKNIKMHNSPRDETNSHRTSIQESVNKQNIGDASEKNRNTNRSAQTRRTKATSTVPEESHQIPEICSKSISGKCKDTGCPRLHSKRHFHWQVTADFATWYDFPEAHVLFLENHFCDPENDLILLRKLDDSCPDRALLSLLGYQLWEIGFVYATWENNCAKCPIRSKDSQYYIRRLCSERSQKKIRANRFIWYFQDDSRKWLPFDAGSNKRLEEAHQRDPEGRVKIETGRARYRVDFSKMKQENESTKRQRRIQRRPLPMQGFI